MAVRILSGVLMLPMAKFIDEFGRAHGFLMTTGLTILGLIIQTSAQSLATTIVAQILHGIGWNCLGYVLTIVLADMTTLKNRGMLFSHLSFGQTRHEDHVQAWRPHVRSETRT